jgi:hypothetical protein
VTAYSLSAAEQQFGEYFAGNLDVDPRFVSVDPRDRDQFLAVLPDSPAGALEAGAYALHAVGDPVPAAPQFVQIS